MSVNKVLVVKRLKEISGYSPCDSTERDSWEVEANQLLRLCERKEIHIPNVVMLTRRKPTITPEESNLISWKSFVETISLVIIKMDNEIALEKKYGH